MKYLAAAAAALFLLAAPGASFAQNNNTGGSNGANSNNGGGDTTGSTTRQDSKNGSCGHLTQGQSFDTLNEECRREIKIWLGKQNDAGAEFKGDLAVGSDVPADVTVTEVPAYSGYGYARLNGKRVLIDRETHKVISID